MSDLLECGHPPSEHGPHTLGYGSDPTTGARSCYDCCAAIERAAMIERGRATLYLVTRTERVPQQNAAYYGLSVYRSAVAVDRWYLTDWPGRLEFRAFNVTRSHGYGFGARYQITSGRFAGPDGFVWRFRNAGHQQIAQCYRTKTRASA